MYIVNENQQLNLFRQGNLQFQGYKMCIIDKINIIFAKIYSLEVFVVYIFRQINTVCEIKHYVNMCFFFFLSFRMYGGQSLPHYYWEHVSTHPPALPPMTMHVIYESG